MTPVFFPECNKCFFSQKILILAYINQNISIKQKLTGTETNGARYRSSSLTFSIKKWGFVNTVPRFVVD